VRTTWPTSSGIEWLGPMTDRLGRHGIGVGFTQYGGREGARRLVPEIVRDPDEDH
jgi:hypothetical protein